MTHPDTPELDELDTLFERSKIFIAHSPYCLRIEHVTDPSVADWCSCGSELVAKRAIRPLLAKRELGGRIDEVNRTVVAQGSYPADLSYSSDRDGFFVVPKNEVIDRMAELREELTKYE